MMHITITISDGPVGLTRTVGSSLPAGLGVPEKAFTVGARKVSLGRLPVAEAQARLVLRPIDSNPAQSPNVVGKAGP
eukprot:332581-Rhodomonas_salina.7